jgi:RNA exonuclease 1
MSQPVVSSELEDGNSMHHRVARLSITVTDNSFDERQTFLSSLKSQTEETHDEVVSDSEEKKDDEDAQTKSFSALMKPGRAGRNERNKLRKLQKKLRRQQESNELLDSAEELKHNSTSDLAIDDSNDTILKSIRGSKRRRSSVAQNVIVRKKKFLAELPKLTILSDKNKKASISSVRDLLLYSLTDMDLRPNWCRLANRKSVDKFVVIFLRGLTNEEFGMPCLKDEINPFLISKYKLNENLSNFGNYFQEVIPMLAPGSKKCIYSTYSSLVSYTLSNKQKASIKKENEARKIILPDLYLTLEEMLFNSYPIHKDVKGATQEMINRTSDFKSTTDFNHVGSTTFALDCEMCRSANGRVLTRVSLTDFDNNIIIDKFIKPTEPIVDYLTQWSGITEEKLIGVETTVEDIQNEILSIVSSNDTLIGHSLESDLHVLKIKHPKIVDTSICFDHPRGPPSKASLKMLMSSHLDTSIQISFSGHDSVEDCISCMELVKLKITKGYLYGKSYNMESLFKRISQNNKLIKCANGDKIPKSSVVIGYSAVKNFGHHESQIQCRSDDEIVDKFIETQKDNDLIILKLRELEWFKEYSKNNIVEDLKLPETMDEMYAKVNERLARIYENLTPNSILLVCSENGDTREMLRLQELCKAFKYKVEKDENNEDVHVKDESWSEENSEKLVQALDEARDTLFLCSLKPFEAQEEAIKTSL